MVLVPLQTHVYSSIPLQGNVLTQNMSSGVIFSTHSLVLQGVTRHNAGSYTCGAVNAKGETSSEPVTLRVQCEYIQLSLQQLS